MKSSSIVPGEDPDFPFLGEYDRYSFPDPMEAKHDSIIAWGGNLSPGMLLSAYEQGLFPWYNEDDPILWHSPDPRFVIFPRTLHISASMKKLLKHRRYSIKADRDFPAVIRACSAKERPGQDGTWLSKEMIAAYIEMHRLGWAHSAEAYDFFESDDSIESATSGEQRLVGGCYGIRLGNIFFGESMFSLKPNASKAAFLSLAQFLFNDGVRLIDCQQHTNHMENLGGVEISRKEFLVMLYKEMARRMATDGDKADRRGNWEGLINSD